MRCCAVISGTVPAKDEMLLAGEETRLDSPYGPATIIATKEALHLFRHGSGDRAYILPHMVNHPANLWALKELGAEGVIGICSTGSVKGHIPPGSLVIPDDFIMPAGAQPSFPHAPVHIAPSLDTGMRNRLLKASQLAQEVVIDGGVYWQSIGPRLETRAEIRMIALFADIVGMTMAGEAIAAQELGLPYAALCSVDNYAHGLGDKVLTLEEITSHARENAKRVCKVVKEVLKIRAAGSVKKNAA